MSESAIGQRWIYTTAAGDATLVALIPGGIHVFEAPTGTTGKFVIIKPAGASDGQGMGGTRGITVRLYQVYGRYEGRSTVALEAIANRLDALLHRPTQGPWAVTGGIILSSLRNQGSPEINIGFRDTNDGKFYTLLGGTYRLEITKE